MKVVTTRNVAVLLGLWTGSGFVAAFLAFLLKNSVLSYSASSADPGSFFVLRLVWAIPWIPAAAAGGALIPALIESRRTSAWAVALSLLFTVFYLSSAWSENWGWANADSETRLGMLLTAFLVGASCFVGFAIARKRRGHQPNVV